MVMRIYTLNFNWHIIFNDAIDFPSDQNDFPQLLPNSPIQKTHINTFIQMTIIIHIQAISNDVKSPTFKASKSKLTVQWTNDSLRAKGTNPM